MKLNNSNDDISNGNSNNNLHVPIDVTLLGKIIEIKFIQLCRPLTGILVILLSRITLGWLPQQ